MKWLLIGGAGFTGRYFVKELRKRYPKSNITVCDIQEVRFNEVERCKADLSDREQIYAILERVHPDYVVNLAGVFKTEDILLSLQINTLILIHICEYFKNNPDRSDKLQGILAIGSAAQYGKIPSSSYPNEDYLCNPSNVYGWTKLLQEKLGLQYYRLHNIPIYFTRTSNLLGPGMSENFVVPLILKQIMDALKDHSEPLVRIRNINAGRDFIDIRDAVQAYILLLTNPDLKGRVFNIGNNKVTMLEDVISIIKNYLKLESIEIRGNSSKLPDINILDCSSAKKDMNWSPKIKLEDTLRDMIDYLRK